MPHGILDFAPSLEQLAENQPDDAGDLN